MSWLGTVALLLGAYYLYAIGVALTRLMNPLSGEEFTERDWQYKVTPLWPVGSKFDLYGFLSSSISFPAMNLSDFSQSPSFHLVLEKKNLVFNESSPSLSKVNDLEIDLNITQKTLGSKDIWRNLQRNSSSVFLHTLLVHHSRRSRNPVVSKDDYTAGMALHSRIQMIKHDKVPRSFRHRYLLGDFGLVTIEASDAARASMSPDHRSICFLLRQLPPRHDLHLHRRELWAVVRH